MNNKTYTIHIAYLRVRILGSFHMKPVERHECDSSANLLLVHSLQDTRSGRVSVNHHVEQAVQEGE